VLTRQPPPEPVAHDLLHPQHWCGVRPPLPVRGQRNHGSVEWRVDVGDTGLRVVIEGAIVATEWGFVEHALDGDEDAGGALGVRVAGSVAASVLGPWRL
jgi:hypothetical protein